LQKSRVLKHVARSVGVITRPSKHRAQLEELGVRVVPFDFRRGSSNPVGEGRSILALSRILREEQPDVVHLVATKAMVLGGLAARLGWSAPRKLFCI